MIFGNIFGASERAESVFSDGSRVVYSAVNLQGPYSIRVLRKKLNYVPVAQLDRASDYGSEGRRFESFRAHFLKDEGGRMKDE